MDKERWKQLADAAISGHWPPHLLAPDEDRLVVVGETLRAAVNSHDDYNNQIETLEDEAEAAELEIDELKKEIAELKAK